MTPNTEKVVMVKAGPLINVPALMYAIAESRRLYTDFGNPPPPIPENVASFPPCSLLITEQYDISTGKRIGRVQILRDDATSLFDQKWIVAEVR